MASRSPLQADRRKVTLIILYIPSVERDGKAPVDQDLWVQKALYFAFTKF
jgi:hypothetical protein